MQNSALKPAPQASLSSLGDQITELAAHLDAGTYQLLKLISEFDQREGWNGTGILSCAHWLNWKCGISLGAAREKVRAARALASLPQISAVFRAGKVSYSKVRAMTRVATAENESALLEVALGGTASHVEQQVRLFRKTKRIAALQQENDRHNQRGLSWYQDHDGSWVFKGRLTPAQGALVSKALEAAMDQLFEEQRKVPENVPAGTSNSLGQVSAPVAARRADALERVAEGFLADAIGDHSGGGRYMLNIHTDTDTLKANGEGAISFTLPTGELIPRGPESRSRGNVLVLKTANRNNGLNIKPETPIPAWYGDRIDKQMAVDALMP